MGSDRVTGELRRVTIERMGHRGEGVAIVDEAPVFIPLTLPGETLTARIAGKRGHLETLESPSPERTDPVCPHFGACGGCQLQHMNPGVYAGFKRDLVVAALAREKIEADVAPLVFAHGQGRRRARMHYAQSRAGFAALRSHTIHDLDHCPILAPGLADAPRIARDLGAAIGPCDLAFTETPMGPDVAISAKRAAPNAALTRAATRHRLARVSINGEVVLIFATPAIAMGRARVRLPTASFLQATAQAEEILASHVMAAARGAGLVADLFSGVGPFALRLAENHKVYAADTDKGAIGALAAAARATQGLKSIQAERRDLFREPLGTFELNQFDCVVIDPPRAGAQAQARELSGSKVGTIVYVSCDPGSFARDAAILIAGGYTMASVTPVDQFAYSAHIEMVAVFNK